MRVHRRASARHAQGAVRLDHQLVHPDLRRCSSDRDGVHHVRRRAVGAGDARAGWSRGPHLPRACHLGPRLAGAGRRSTSRRSTRATSRAREGSTWAWSSRSWRCRGSNRSLRWRRRPRTRAATCRSRSSARSSSSRSSTSSSTGASWSASARRASWPATSRRPTRSSTSPGGCGESAWLLVLFATVNSALAVSIAIQNATTRVLFSMGRAGALPTWLGQVHPKFKTPWNAIWLMTAFIARARPGRRLVVRPDRPVRLHRHRSRCSGSCSCTRWATSGAFLYFYRERRSEFNWFLHFVIPLATLARAPVGRVQDHRGRAPAASRRASSTIRSGSRWAGSSSAWSS